MCGRDMAEHPRHGVSGMHRWAGDLSDHLEASPSLGVMEQWLPKESSEGGRGQPVKRNEGDMFQREYPRNEGMWCWEVSRVTAYEIREGVGER